LESSKKTIVHVNGVTEYENKLLTFLWRKITSETNLYDRSKVGVGQAQKMGKT